LRDGGTEHDEVGIFGGSLGVASCVIHDAEFLAFADAGGAADQPVDRFGESALTEGEAERSAEQADAGQGDFVEQHGDI
jgi:hypothetical protein